MMSKQFKFMSVALAMMSATTILAGNNSTNIMISGCKVNNNLDAPIVLGTESDDEIFEVVEKKPQYVGGLEALMSYISQSVKYPKVAQENAIQGKFYLSFVVDKDGSIMKEHTTVANVDGKDIKNPNTFPQVLVNAYADNKQKNTGKAATEEEMKNVETAYKALAEESTRVINSMPNWIPGEQRGKKVRVRYILPITFRLQ